METLPLIAVMFLLTACAALLWLTVRAFKTNLSWGFAVLLLSPVSAIAFGVKYWKKQREPFLLYITTFTATLVLCIYMITVTGSMELQRLSNTFQQEILGHTLAKYGNGDLRRASYSVGENSADDGMFLQDPDFFKGHASAENTGENHPNSLEKETAGIDAEPATQNNQPVRYRLTYIPIELTEINKHIGATAKITRKNAQEKEYVISGASPRHIEVAQRSRNGKYSFHFKNSDIEKVRVLVNEAY